MTSVMKVTQSNRVRRIKYLSKSRPQQKSTNMCQYASVCVSMRQYAIPYKFIGHPPSSHSVSPFTPFRKPVTQQSYHTYVRISSGLTFIDLKTLNQTLKLFIFEVNNPCKWGTQKNGMLYKLHVFCTVHCHISMNKTPTKCTRVYLHLTHLHVSVLSDHTYTSTVTHNDRQGMSF